MDEQTDGAGLPRPSELLPPVAAFFAADPAFAEARRWVDWSIRSPGPPQALDGDTPELVARGAAFIRVLQRAMPAFRPDTLQFILRDGFRLSDLPEGEPEGLRRALLALDGAARRMLAWRARSARDAKGQVVVSVDFLQQAKMFCCILGPGGRILASTPGLPLAEIDGGLPDLARRWLSGFAAFAASVHVDGAAAGRPDAALPV